MYPSCVHMFHLPAVSTGITCTAAQRGQKSLKWFLKPGTDEDQLWGFKNRLVLWTPQAENHYSVGLNMHTRVAFEQTDLSFLNDFSTDTKMLIASVK